LIPERRRGVLLGAGAILVAGVIATAAFGRLAFRENSANPFVGAKLFVDRDSNAYWSGQALRDNGRIRDAKAMAKIADHPWASWFGDWSNGHGSLFKDVRARVNEISANGSLPVLVAYDITLRDCGEYSSGGADSPALYRKWIGDFRSGIGDHRAVVILEPDALAGLDCLSAAERQTRISLLKESVSLLASSPRISVYIDAGNQGWHSPEVMARRLQEVGIGKARGFALNVSNFYSDKGERAYGHRLSALLGGKPFVIDTSRNGRGPAPRNRWCNPPGRGLGRPATAKTGDPLIDAYLWVKPPGESDGDCRGAPPAGVWWPSYALGLARRAAF
jgi:endoglucanase